MRERQQLGKFLAYVLRHAPEAHGVELDANGWAPVSQVLAACATAGYGVTIEELRECLDADAKQRFAIHADGLRIRANQGHSVAVDLELTAQTPPDVLYQGTVARFLPGIEAAGLLPQSRHHVHLSADPATAREVGSRRGEPVVLTIDAAAMHRAGYSFYRSANGVWLTCHVPFEFLTIPES